MLNGTGGKGDKNIETQIVLETVLWYLFVW